ncbi:hypothetical protein [Quadrisphaera sp. KR29]|uniref:hypothetical protein n=1 Tax=Quadrisphaera sp. KR29 TaxID=3461391 RepID=UPI004044E0D4
MRPRLLMPLLAPGVLVGALALSGCTSGVAGAAGAPRTAPPSSSSSSATTAGEVQATSLVLVVTPHPDDELEAWAALPESTDTYPVFLTMTDGEGTANCEPGEYAANQWAQVGEVAPTPAPSGKRSQSCRDARLDSWGRFLERSWAQGTGQPVESPPEQALPVAATGGLEPAVDHPAGTPPATTARAWVGQRSARVAVSAGDGDVTPEEVRWAVASVLAARGAVLPDLPLLRVLGATYSNDAPDAGTHRAGDDGTCHDRPCTGDSAAAEYEHPDHLAVREALLAPGADLGADEGTWVATWPSDPLATHVASLGEQRYEQLMGLGAEVVPGRPDSRERLGTMQQEYGWLGFPGGYWPQTEVVAPDGEGAPLIMARTQSFVVVP